jgi:hypothetical protein
MDAVTEPRVETRRSLRERWHGRSRFEKLVIVLLTIALAVLLFVIVTNKSRFTVIGGGQTEPGQMGEAILEGIDPRLSKLESGLDELRTLMKAAAEKTEAIDKRLTTVENKPAWTKEDYKILTDTIAGKKKK